MIRWLLYLALAALVLRALRRRLGAPRPTPAPAGAPAWDPWAVLGVPRGASRGEITHAYHEQLRRYHPDRVADLGSELQHLAHEKTIELRRAYDELAR